MADAAPLLEVEDIETCYGLSQVLFGLSLQVRTGEMVALMGRNGMGKTTTIRSIMGLTPARAGADPVRRQRGAQAASFRIAQLGIGLVPEGRQIFPNLTVRENLVAASGNRLVAPTPGPSKRSTRCSPGWPSAATIWAARCRAASSRCWRSAAR
jgi:branched-chain amino acid transport system ATP-binding protein